MDWEAEWSAAKKMWCCGHKGVGCLSTPVGTLAPAPGPAPPAGGPTFFQSWGSLIFSIVVLGLASAAVAVLGPRIWKSQSASAFELMHRGRGSRGGGGRSLHLQRGDRVAVRNSFSGVGSWWGRAPLARGTAGVVEDVDNYGRATIAFSDHLGKFTVPQADFENLELQTANTVAKSRTGIAVALAVACTLLALILTWHHSSSQSAATAPVPTAAPTASPMAAGSGAGCCSWDGGAHCGQTTPWCKASKANCEGHCKGQWKYT